MTGSCHPSSAANGNWRPSAVRAAMLGRRLSIRIKRRTVAWPRSFFHSPRNPHDGQQPCNVQRFEARATLGDDTCGARSRRLTRVVPGSDAELSLQ